MSKQSKYVLKQGHSGDLVEDVQERLGLRVDGVFGPRTRDAIKAFQIDNGLKGDGVVGPMTWKKLGLSPHELEADTDITTGATWIEQYPLPDGEYVKQETAKKWIFIHHTAGRHNPYKVIDQWAKTKSGTMHRGSISIEICSAGRLTKRDGKYYTWYNSEVHPDQVCTLDHTYKGQLYFHKYSAKQIESLKALLILLSEKHGIDLHVGVISELSKLGAGPTPYGVAKPNPADLGRAFEYSDLACSGKVQGLLTHGQVRTDKDDVQPQTELINMLLTL